VFPALTTQRGWDNTKFTLRAENGFMVTAERKDNITKYVAIESLMGNEVQIENPWGEGNSVIVRMQNGTQVYSGADRIIKFATKTNEVYILEEDSQPYSSLAFEMVALLQERTKKKTLGDVTYGFGDSVESIVLKKDGNIVTEVSPNTTIMATTTLTGTLIAAQYNDAKQLVSVKKGVSNLEFLIEPSTKFLKLMVWESIEGQKAVTEVKSYTVNLL